MKVVYKKIFILISIFSLLLIESCGIFAPRDEYAGDIEKIKADPLKFADILTGTNAGFSKLDYEEIFHHNMNYVDPENVNYSQHDVIHRLNSIVDVYDTISVVWILDSTQQQHTRVFNKNDTVSVYRHYRVSWPPYGDTLSGDSHFKFIFHDIKNTWAIYYWKDTPSENRSFFHPLYID